MTNALDSETARLQGPGALPDMGRRKLLVAATGIAGGAGIVAASIPFVISMAPSERARAGGAPIDVDFVRLGPGEQLTTEWQGKPVWILHLSTRGRTAGSGFRVARGLFLPVPRLQVRLGRQGLS